MRCGHSLVLALTFVASVAAAQPPARGGGAGRRGGPPPAGDPQRSQRAVRQALERVVRNQVRPTETQLRQLQALDQRLEPQRVQLNRDEQSARVALRQLMLDTVNVDQARIGEALDRLVRFPARRAALMESEQKELATILTPLQRAKYQAIQEQVRRQIERGRGGRPPTSPPPESLPNRSGPSVPR